MGKTKKDQLKDMPKPPSKEHILADLDNADENDIVFKTNYPG